MLLCVAEANEKYRLGEAIISDSEYDYLVEHTNAQELTSKVGTGLTVELVLFYLGHTEENHYMSSGRRSNANPPKPKPEPPSSFSALVKGYTTYRNENWGGSLQPSEVTYNPHRVSTLRVWDSDAQQMDYGVMVVDGKMLIMADADDDVSTWTAEETANIAGQYYFAMPLDEYFTIMEDTDQVDAEGRTLYEGDIVEGPDGAVFVVVRDGHWKRWILSTKTTATWTPSSLSISLNYAAICKHVGNIHQDKALLPDGV
jgi:hypothetical protein